MALERWRPLRKVEVKDPLKQGLKLCEQVTGSSREVVEVKDPLKQGLKHYITVVEPQGRGGWSERSIKTRIETDKLMQANQPWETGWSERSIKTRIET